MISGQPHTTLCAVIAVAVTTFEMFRELASAHNSFRLTAKADHSVVLTDLLQMHLIEACPEKIDLAALLPPPLCAWVNIFTTHT